MDNREFEDFCTAIDAWRPDMAREDQSRHMALWYDDESVELKICPWQLLVFDILRSLNINIPHPRERCVNVLSSGLRPIEELEKEDAQNAFEDSERQAAMDDAKVISLELWRKEHKR